VTPDEFERLLKGRMSREAMFGSTRQPFFLRSAESAAFDEIIARRNNLFRPSGDAEFDRILKRNKWRPPGGGEKRRPPPKPPEEPPPEEPTP
jgi:hypothetical protein